MRRYVVVVIVLALLLSGCGDRCTKRETAEFLDQFEDIIGRWDATNALAGSTARIALSPVVQQLQGIKNEVDDLEDICEEAVDAKDQVTRYMDLTIEGYLLFMSDESESSVSSKIRQANAALELAAQKLAALEEYK